MCVLSPLSTTSEILNHTHSSVEMFLFSLDFPCHSLYPANFLAPIHDILFDIVSLSHGKEMNNTNMIGPMT